MLADKNVADHLVKARELIADPNNWCQGAYGVSKEGNPLLSTQLADMQQPGARMCAMSALRIASGGNATLFGQMADALTGDDTDRLFAVCFLNNRSTHEELMKTFNQTINQLREPEMA